MTEEELIKELDKLWKGGRLYIEHKEGDIVGVGGGFTSKPTRYYKLCNGEWIPHIVEEKK